MPEPDALVSPRVRLHKPHIEGEKTHENAPALIPEKRIGKPLVYQ